MSSKVNDKNNLCAQREKYGEMTIISEEGYQDIREAIADLRVQIERLSGHIRPLLDAEIGRKMKKRMIQPR